LQPKEILKKEILDEVIEGSASVNPAQGNSNLSHLKLFIFSFAHLFSSVNKVKMEDLAKAETPFSKVCNQDHVR